MTKPNARQRTKRVVFQPDTYQGLQRGISQLVDAVRPTLGPLPRVVAFHQVVTTKMPEILTKGGVIARRIIQLADRDADMGAMLARDLLCHLHERYGDGTATAAVLLQSVYDAGVHYLASGGNAMRLRHYLEEGAQLILDELTDMTIRVEGKEQLAQIAQSICNDPPLARMLGEVFDIIGEYGQIEIETIRSRDLKREYVDGMYWEATGLLSREMITDQARGLVEMENASILISDLDIEESNQLLPVLTAASKSGIRSLLIIANKLSTSAISLLVSNRDPDKFQAIAVKTPGVTKEGAVVAIEDLAVLTGGRRFVRAAGDNLQNINAQDFGQARRVWADRSRFGVVGGKGDARALRKHIVSLRSRFGQEEDAEVRRKLQQRLGKLMGGAAKLQIGGASQENIETRTELAEQAAGALRGAIRDGVLPGGGVALLACRPALKRGLDQSVESDARAAYHILIGAMEAPARTIFTNAGYDASEVMAEIKLAGPGHGLDVISQQVVPMAEAGIFDVAAVVRAAVGSAITTAAMALTIDVLVHHKKPQEVPGGT